MNPTGNDPILETRNMTRILPGKVPVTLVEDVTLSFIAGEFAAITGPSGSGKSSLLYLLGLLDTPTAGKVFIDGRDTAGLDAEARADLRLEYLGFVFQFHFLLPEFSILANTLIPMRQLGRLSAAQMRERAEGLLTSLGLADHMNKRPDQLSGGERQRAAVARALANDPPIVLADEPTGNLDTHNSGIVFDIFAGLVRDQGKTIIAVTHDMELAARAPRQVRLVDAHVVRDEGGRPSTGPAGRTHAAVSE
jgi:lipoprotein-releasing system ATP-binding protein